MQYALDLAALPIGAVVIAVDCWGESPTAFRVVERETHHIVGVTSAGKRVFLGGPLVTRMARPDEAAAFAPEAHSTSAAPAASKAPAPIQMEMF
ncbi:hypothetical protein [Pleomorphomonas koreensis]|uniref:hypothetical protein n=1 Tax=Pleomorphomonas koreensis TaxID=257440 RepID=UPI000429548C|nr:hypothetical protein [Pleomorphomonas koreensis]